MLLTQSNLFKRIYKKLQTTIRTSVNEQIKKITENPEIGELKKGDLAGIRVHKFKYQQHLYLLAYEYSEKDGIYLIAIGEHENFYSKMKRHLYD